MKGLIVPTLLAAASLCAGPALAGAQDVETPFQGRVLADETGRPVPGIQVRFPDGTRVTTDVDGGFQVYGLALGTHEVALVGRECEVSFGEILVVPGTTWETQLSFPQNLADILPALDEQGISGLVVGPAEIDRMHATTLVDVVRRVAPAMLDPGNRLPGQTVGVRGRNRATLSGETEPIFFLDGVWLGESPEVLTNIAPADVAAMEIMPGVQGAWKYGSSGGMVRIWTWQGIQPKESSTIDDCVVDLPPAEDAEGNSKTRRVAQVSGQ